MTLFGCLQAKSYSIFVAKAGGGSFMFMCSQVQVDIELWISVFKPVEFPVHFESEMASSNCNFSSRPKSSRGGSNAFLESLSWDLFLNLGFLFDNKLSNILEDG